LRRQQDRRHRHDRQLQQSFGQCYAGRKSCGVAAVGSQATYSRH
jgi:hypothetical protein